MADKTEFKFTLKPSKSLVKLYNLRRKDIFQEIATYLDTTRRVAADEFIIPNTSGTKHPYKASKLQPSVPGVLTSRTGNLIRMLKNKTTSPGKNWSFTNLMAKQQTNSLKGTIRATERNTRMEAYRGSYRVDIQADALLDSKVNKSLTGRMVKKHDIQTGKEITYEKKETKKTLFFRYMHELGANGLKGGGKRPFLAPAAKKLEPMITQLVGRRLQQRINQIG